MQVKTAQYISNLSSNRQWQQLEAPYYTTVTSHFNGISPLLFDISYVHLNV